MPGNLNFVDKLMEARRRAQMTGRPLTRKETSGVVSGYAEIASERLARAKALELEKRRQDIGWEKAHREREMARKESRAGAVAGGAAVGFAIAGGPVGALVGGAVGFVADKVCIIITACTDPYSYEVQVARAYRDTFMSAEELAGYYLLAYYVEPLILHHPRRKAFVKKWLVDRLVDYGEVVLGVKTERSFASSYLITRLFLGGCRQLGRLALAILRRLENAPSIS